MGGGEGRGRVLGLGRIRLSGNELGNVESFFGFLVVWFGSFCGYFFRW